MCIIGPGMCMTPMVPNPLSTAVFGDLRAALPTVRTETRMDSAFFNEDIVDGLHKEGIEFTISVPFERFADLKGIIEGRRRWHRLNAELDYFESRWKPKCWGRRYRFVFIRKCVKRQHKEPIQLDLFIPIEHDYEFKVIVTNKRLSARKVVVFHEGRGSQEGLIGELKSHCQMDYVPGDHAPRQSTLFAGRHSRPQSHPRTTHAGRPASARHHREARTAVALPGACYPSPNAHPTSGAYY